MASFLYGEMLLYLNVTDNILCWFIHELLLKKFSQMEKLKKCFGTVVFYVK